MGTAIMHFHLVTARLGNATLSIALSITLSIALSIALGIAGDIALAAAPPLTPTSCMPTPTSRSSPTPPPLTLLRPREVCEPSGRAHAERSRRVRGCTGRADCKAACGVLA